MKRMSKWIAICAVCIMCSVPVMGADIAVNPKPTEIPVVEITPTESPTPTPVPKVKNGWYTFGSKKRYYKNDKYYVGMKKVSEDQSIYYFDKNGYALESHEKKYDNVPLVTGLKYNELQMQKKIDVKDEKVFSYLLELTTAISKYHLPIDQIHIKDDGNALLISGDITVDLYDKNDIDIKIPELKGMLKKVKGKSGTIDMRYFSEDRKIAIFQPKNS